MTHDFSPGTIRFGVFQVNLATRELRKHGVRMRIAPEPLRILILLLERAGQVVAREELRAKLWSHDTLADFRHALNKAISRLRQTLSDSARRPLYIETLPRLGYRFIAPVDLVAGPQLRNCFISDAGKSEGYDTSSESKDSSITNDQIRRPFALLDDGCAAAVQLKRTGVFSGEPNGTQGEF
jgi:DNA-binding winged helix-turn-helix (wHTH) protein